MDSANNYDFEAGDELSDLEILVEGKTIRVHKAILGKIEQLAMNMTNK